MTSPGLRLFGRRGRTREAAGKQHACERCGAAFRQGDRSRFCSHTCHMAWLRDAVSRGTGEDLDPGEAEEVELAPVELELKAS